MEAGEYHEDRDVIDFFWQDSNRWQYYLEFRKGVVNCFWIYIFDKIPTGPKQVCLGQKRLWIAFEFISLTRFQQVLARIFFIGGCCELLLNLYLWQDSNRKLRIWLIQSLVVNCFWIYIFDKIPTGTAAARKNRNWLWIAFEFISLTRFQQGNTRWTRDKIVVNCFWIYIFDKIPTGSLDTIPEQFGLWIAFEFISLTRFQQARHLSAQLRICCELLLNLYLWQDSNRFFSKP